MSADLSGYGSVALPIIVNRTQPVGNQVIAESQTAANAATRQAQQSVQATDWSFVHQTDGDGVFTFTLTFDVAFTREPAFAHGMAFTDFAATVQQDVATASAAVQTAATSGSKWSFADGLTITPQGDAGSGSTYDKVTGQSVTTTSWKATVAGTSGSQVRALVQVNGQTFTTVTVTDGTMRLERPTSGTSTWTLQRYDTTSSSWVTQSPLTGSVDTSAAHSFAAAATTSTSTATAALEKALASGTDTDKIPLSSAYVKRWLIDSQGNYTGADMLIVVRTFTTVAAEPEESSSDSGVLS